MCGRFLLRCPPENWPADLLGDPEYGGLFTPPETPSFEARLNIAPTQSVLCIIQTSPGYRRDIQMLRWGLVPSWAEDRKIGASMINARSETVEQKPSFRTAFSQRRCLIPADGYYEWITVGKTKQPMLIERTSSQLFCFAGLWERNNKLSADTVESFDLHKPLLTCTIITTAANPSMVSIHNRMPVVIEPQDYLRWLDPNYREVPALKALLKAANDDYFQAKPVEKVSGK